MNAWRWLLRSLRHHGRQHAAVAAGAALAAAVLTGAWLAGDSLQQRLRSIALERVGPVRTAVEAAAGRLEPEMADALAATTGGRAAPVLRLTGALRLRRGGAVTADIPRVEVLAVDDRFFALAGPAAAGPARFLLTGSTNPAPVLFAQALADAAGGLPPAPADPADAPLLALVPPPSAAVGMPLGREGGDAPRLLPVKPAGVLPDAALGRFGLAATQRAPRNLFVPRSWLAAALPGAGGVNLVLADADPAGMRRGFAAALLPEHLGIGLAREPAAAPAAWLVTSPRVFLPDGCTRAIQANLPDAVLGLHYLADSFAAGDGAARRETPYGFVTALTPSADPRLGVVPAGMGDGELVVNAWLAEVLAVGPGDRVRLACRRFEPGGRLEPASAEFRVRSVAAMEDLALERSRLPAFPGLSDVMRCRDWNVGLPMDPVRLADPANERYWNAYGPTPKAFLTLAAGRRLFGVHFGAAMSARLPPDHPRDAIVQALRAAPLESLGVTVRPVREEALAAVTSAQDFRQLFAGLSFVLAFTALLLAGMTAGLAAARRRDEAGILAACGVPASRVRRLLAIEMAAPLLAGSLAGSLAGGLYGRAVVWGLNRVWTAAVAGTAVQPAFGWRAWAAGFVLSVLAGGAALSLATVRYGRARAVDLLAGRLRPERIGPADRAILTWTAAAAGLAAAVLEWVAVRSAAGSDQGGPALAAGMLAAVAAVCAVQALLGYWCQRAPGAGGAVSASRWAFGPGRAGVLNLTRQPGRSLLAMLLAAGGTCLVIGVQALRQDPAAEADATVRWLAEAPRPVTRQAGQSALARAFGPEAAARAVAVRVQPGDEADCLNLNRAGRPRLLGVPSETLRSRGAFPGRDGRDPWTILQQPLPDGCVPGLAGDRTTAAYGLHARADPARGAVIEYPQPRGGTLRIRLVGTLPARASVFQGSILVDEAVFDRAFPEPGGYSLWLLDDRQTRPAAAAATLRRQGWDLEAAADRLTALGRVESAYLDMFLALGGFGLVLGMGGFGVTVLRNAWARRPELAMLRALGVSRRGLFRHLAAESLALLTTGLAAGTAAAALVLWPAQHALRGGIPVAGCAALAVAALLAGAAVTAAAATAASRAPLLPSLRGE